MIFMGLIFFFDKKEVNWIKIILIFWQKKTWS